MTLSLTQGLGRVEEYRSYGFSEKELENFWENPSMKYRQESPFSFTYVADGDVLTYGGAGWRSYSLPATPPATSACMTARTR